MHPLEAAARDVARRYVDALGGVYPHDVRRIAEAIRRRLDCERRHLDETERSLGEVRGEADSTARLEELRILLLEHWATIEALAGALDAARRKTPLWGPA